MDERPEASQDDDSVPPEVTAVLGSTLQRILAEVTFADAWIRTELSSDPRAIVPTDLHVLLPQTAPWVGRLLLSGDLPTVQDLAAGFHSIPDEMVDRTIALDFLAELGSLLLRDLFCASDVAVEMTDPLELSPPAADIFWKEAGSARAALGCNQGRIFAALAGS